jgi:hypothetical protein
VGSGGGIDLVVVSAGDYIFEPYYTNRLTRGEYELDLSFNDSERHSAFTELSIE